MVELLPTGDTMVCCDESRENIVQYKETIIHYVSKHARDFPLVFIGTIWPANINT